MMVALKPDNNFMDLIDYIYQLRLKHRDLFFDRKDEDEYIENYTKTIAAELTKREEKIRELERHFKQLTIDYHDNNTYVHNALAGTGCDTVVQLRRKCDWAMDVVCLEKEYMNTDEIEMNYYEDRIADRLKQ